MDNPALWWLGLGFGLLILEMLTGALFCLWLSFAAFATAAVCYLVGPGLVVQLLVFAVASVLSIAGWRHFRPDSRGGVPASNGLNNRMAVLVGREVMLQEAIAQGDGRVNIDDAWWQAQGEDMPAGSRVRVVSVEGMVLRLQRLDS